MVALRGYNPLLMADTLIKAKVDEAGRVVLVPANVEAQAQVDALALLKDADGLLLRISRDAEGRLHMQTLADVQEELGWLKLAESSMAFWDNPVDDAVWNNA